MRPYDGARSYNNPKLQSSSNIGLQRQMKHRVCAMKAKAWLALDVCVVSGQSQETLAGYEIYGGLKDQQKFDNSSWWDHEGFHQISFWSKRLYLRRLAENQ